MTDSLRELARGSDLLILQNMGPIVDFGALTYESQLLLNVRGPCIMLPASCFCLLHSSDLNMRWASVCVLLLVHTSSLWSNAIRSCIHADKPHHSPGDGPPAGRPAPATRRHPPSDGAQLDAAACSGCHGCCGDQHMRANYQRAQQASCLSNEPVVLHNRHLLHGARWIL